MVVWGWEVGRSEGRSVMGRIEVETLPHVKAGRRPTGLSLQRIWRTVRMRKSK